MLAVGDRVELRKHAADREREDDRARGVDAVASVGHRFQEGTVEEAGRTYAVRWDDGRRSTHPASHLKVVPTGGRRARHEELYGPRGLKHRVEDSGRRLREALRELWVPEQCDREYARPEYVKLDFPGVHNAGMFDDRRREYERLVAAFNRKARRHDRDGCC